MYLLGAGASVDDEAVESEGADGSASSGLA